MNKEKKDHSPTDIAVFSMLNSSVFGALYSISLLNKTFEESKLSTNLRLLLILRNILTISTIYGMNQYFRQYFSLKENGDHIKNSIGIQNDIVINIIRCFVSSIIPFSMGYRIYFFRNKNEFISRSVFAVCGLSMLIVELSDLHKNKSF